MQSLHGEAIEEFAHALYGHGIFKRPAAVEEAIRTKLESYFKAFNQTLDCKLYVILDGQPFPGKKSENEVRAIRRQQAYEQGCAFQEGVLQLQREFALAAMEGTQGSSTDELQSKLRDAKKKMTTAFKSCFYRHDKLTEYFVTICRENNIQVHVALYEADAQIAHAVRTGVCDFAVIEDSDAVAYGISSIFGGIMLSKVYESGKATNKIKAAFFNCEKDLFKIHTYKGNNIDMTNWTVHDIQVFGAIVGSDYCSLENMGVAKAKEIVTEMVNYRMQNNKEFKDALVYTLTQYQGTLARSSYTIEDAYSKIMLALASYNSQYVYNLVTYEQTRLNPEWELTERECEFFGAPFPSVCLKHYSVYLRFLCIY